MYKCVHLVQSHDCNSYVSVKSATLLGPSQSIEILCLTADKGHNILAVGEKHRSLKSLAGFPPHNGDGFSLHLEYDTGEY